LFLELFQEAQDQAITSNNIKSAWAAAGLKPFNYTIVLDKLLPTSNLQPATLITKIGDDPILLFIPANTGEVEVLIHRAIQENTLDTKKVLAKVEKAVYYTIAEALIQQSTNSMLVAAIKTKHQKHTREYYRQAQVINIEVVKE
jgi:hypothetical protein